MKAIGNLDWMGRAWNNSIPGHLRLEELDEELLEADSGSG